MMCIGLLYLKKIETARLAILILFQGILFAFAIIKGLVQLPDKISNQFTFQSNIMIRFFISALALSLLGMTLVSKQDPESFEKYREKCRPSQIRTAVGTSLVGIGMFISGSCPGTMQVQIGAGITNVYQTLLGCLIANIVQQMIQTNQEIISEPCDEQDLIHNNKEGQIKNKSVKANKVKIDQKNYTEINMNNKQNLKELNLKNENDKLEQINVGNSVVINLRNHNYQDDEQSDDQLKQELDQPSNDDNDNKPIVHLDKYLNVEFWKIALPLSTLMLIAMIIFEILLPQNSELPKDQKYNFDNYNIYTQSNWAPYLTGLIVATLQVSQKQSANSGLGSSTAIYSSTASLIHILGFENKQSAFVKSGKWKQIVYVLGVTLGAYIFNSGLQYSASSAAYSAAGGFLLYFGARIADGCTTGHGITGFSELNTVSIVGTMFMFGSGIATAVVWSVAGLNIN